MKRIQVIISDEFHRLLKSEAAKMGLDISDVVRGMAREWLMNPTALENEADEDFVRQYLQQKQSGQASAWP